jgi:hypothetical protein
MGMHYSIRHYAEDQIIDAMFQRRDRGRRAIGAKSDDLNIV